MATTKANKKVVVSKTAPKTIFDLGVPVKVSAVKQTIKGYNKMTPYQKAVALDALSVDRTLKRCLRNAYSKAVRDNKKFSLTLKDLQDAWKKQKGKCYWSKVDLDLRSGTRQEPNLNKVSIDRTINKQGYTAKNVKLVTWQVNQAKATGTERQLKTMCKNVAKNN